MTEYMQTFLFERLSSFSNKRMFIDVCKTFFQYLLLHDKRGMEKYQSVFLIPICALLLFCFAVQLPYRGISSCIYLKAVEQ